MIRIYNGKVLTMEEGKDIFHGEVWIDDERIAYVGPSRENGEIVWDEEIDAKGNLIMPGFKNAHTHSAMTFLRSFADDVKLNQWLQEKVFPYEAKLSGKDIYHLTKLAILEYLTSGITANFDMYLTPDTIADAAKDCGYRTVLCGALNDFSQSVEEMEQWYNKYNQGLVTFQLGFHAEYTTSKELLKKIANLSRKYKTPVYTHNSETATEVKDCKERTGMTPTAYMNSLGLFDYGGGLFHCVHMSEEDLDIVKRQNLSVITNPSSNLKLASGIAPMTDMLEKGITLGIGTDGPASNNCLDMFREMFLVTGLAKYRENDASVMDAREVLYMATVGGAKAMGLSDCDVLAKGKLADMIIIDLQQPNMQPEHNIIKNLVYSGSKSNVAMTIINGQIRYKGGEFFVGERAESIYRKANEIARKIIS